MSGPTRSHTWRRIAAPAALAIAAAALLPSASDAQVLSGCGQGGLDAYIGHSSSTATEYQTATSVATVDATCRFHLAGTATDELPGLTIPTAEVRTAATVERVDDLTKGRYRYTFVFEIDDVAFDHRAAYLTDVGQNSPLATASVVFGPGQRAAFATFGHPAEKRYSVTLDAVINRTAPVTASLDFSNRLENKGGSAAFNLDGRVVSIDVVRLGDL